MMNGNPAKMMLSLLIFGLMLAPAAFWHSDAAEHTGIDGTRAILYVGPGQTYSSIQNAVIAASDGDTVRVLAGVYYEQVNLFKKVNLVGSSPSNTTIDGQKLGSVVLVNHEGCSVSGFFITNANPQTMYCGIEITADNATVSDCEIYEVPNGIKISGSNVSLTDCYIHDNSEKGIDIRDSANVTVDGCEIDHNWYYDIYILWSEVVTISDTNLTDSNNGILFHSCKATTVRNVMVNETVGGVWFQYSSFCSISDCIFYNIEQVALHLVCSENIGIINNSFDQSNFEGIQLDGSINITLEDNKLADTGVAIFGNELLHWNSHIIAQNNTVGGKPLFYMADSDGGLVPSGFGEYILANCTNITLRDTTISNSFVGIPMGFCSNVLIENVTIFNQSWGINLYRCYDCVIHQCAVNYCAYLGIYFIDCSGGSVLNSTFNQDEYSIEIEDSDNITIEDCAFTIYYYSSSKVICLYFASNSTILDCTIVSGFNGIYLFNSYNNTIQDTSLTNLDGTGIILERSNNNELRNIYIDSAHRGITLDNSFGNFIFNCTIWRSQYSNSVWGDGIFIYESGLNRIVHCSFVLNDNCGILLSGGDHNLIEGNIFDRNYVGVNLDIYSSNNTITTNNFYMVPDTKASDNGANNRWDRDGRGNYWDDSNILDDDHDLVGDIPYTIPSSGFSQDHFPLMMPHGALTIEPPQNTTAYENVYYEQNLTASGTTFSMEDLDWYLSPESGWMDYKSQHVLYGTPGQSYVGTVRYRFSVTDGSVMDTILVNISVLNVNTPPVIESYPPTLFQEDQTYLSSCYAYDPDSYAGLTWGLASDKDFMYLDQAGGFEADPTNDDVGPGWMNVTVTDPLGLFDFVNLTYYVQNDNDPPKITTSDVTTCNEFEEYRVQYSAFDIDPTNDTLIWGMSTDAAGMKMDTSTGLLTWTPEDIGGNKYWVNISVGDGNGAHDIHEFDLTVLNTEDPPVISDPPATIRMKEDTVDESLDLTKWFTDPDGDTLGFSYSGNVRINVTSISYGKIRLTPPKDWNGAETIAFMASDGRNWVGDDVKVVVEPVNDPPSGLEIIFAQQDYYEKQYQPAYGKAHDADAIYGDSLNLTWYGDKVGKIGYGEYVNLSLFPGVHTITLRVADQSGAVAITSKEITILKDPKNVTAHDDDDDNGRPVYVMLIPVGILLAVIITLAFTIFVLVPRKQEPNPPQEKIKIPRRVRIDREDIDKMLSEMAPVKEGVLKEDEDEALYNRLPMPGDVDFTPQPKEEFSEQDLAALGNAAPAQTPAAEDMAGIPPAQQPPFAEDPPQEPAEQP